MGMSRIPTLIAVQETTARRRVAELVREQADFEVTSECCDGTEALEVLRGGHVEALILDIATPRLDGFSLLQGLEGGRTPAVVFLASGPELAHRAFDAGALDYILKPVDRQRFGRSLERVRAWVRAQRSEAVGGRLSALLDSLRAAADYPARIAVASGSNLVLLPVDEIDWIEAAGNYASIRAAGRVYRVRRTLSSLEATLDPGRFRRVHRGTIVNLSRVREIEMPPGGMPVVRMVDGTAVRLSRGYRHVFSWFGTEIPQEIGAGKRGTASAAALTGSPAGTPPGTEVARFAPRRSSAR
jgi:two-component system LytT family response regulator